MSMAVFTSGRSKAVPKKNENRAVYSQKANLLTLGLRPIVHCV
jgi:hypothetical protein